MSANKKEQPDDFFDPSKLSESSLCKYQVACGPYRVTSRSSVLLKSSRSVFATTSTTNSKSTPTWCLSAS